MVILSKKAQSAVKDFEFFKEFKLFKTHESPTGMNVFLPRLNGKEFDVDSIQESLLEVVVDFSLSRPTVEKYKKEERWSQMSKEARGKFRSYASNTGELGELLLYTFLEGHLNAPQILSKMSLKTTPGDYTKKSDGIHFFREESTGRYYLIFGEAKMYEDLSSAFRKAFESISEHQSGKEFEKSLIYSQIDNEFMDIADRDLVTNLLYPQRASDEIKVTDAFGIFIGFGLDDLEGKTKTEDNYESWIKEKIDTMISSRINTIENYISNEWIWKENKKEYNKKSLIGKKFYVYLIPFTNLSETRSKITKGVTE